MNDGRIGGARFRRFRYAESRDVERRGFWVLEAHDLDEALTWRRNAAVACRASVEVRPFH